MNSSTTDYEGISKVKVEGRPFLLIAKKDNQRGYLKLDNESSLSISQFDVSGNFVNNGIKGFIYGERGVWRPGDTLFLNFILEDKLGTIPENHPIVLELWDARGKLYKKITQTKGLKGFYHFPVSTETDVPTGLWRAVVKIGGVEISSLIRIETVKPNRLKIDLNFNSDEISSKQNDNLSKVNVKWLHGAPAKNLKVSVTANLFPSPTIFKGYEKYSFIDPAKNFNYTENEIFNGNLDENGDLSFSPQFKVNNTSPGKLRASFTTRVFEKGGDFSISQNSVTFSPYPSYIGIKSPAGDKNGVLVTDTIQSFDIVTVSEIGKSVDLKNIEINIYKLDWRWWWDSYGENLASFVSTSYNKPIYNRKINTTDGKGNFTFRVNYPNWGRYLIRVNDPSGKHSSGLISYFDWPGWVNRSSRKDPVAASILSISTDKPKYNVGETATITFPAGENSKAFISIENGSRVLKYNWVKTSEKESGFSFIITEDMAPNVYAYVTLIQPHAQTKNDLPIRMYGVLPIFVEDPLSRLYPVLDMPDAIQPESIIQIKVNEKNNREMTYTLAVVDEGLLDLTKFKTPDPWNTFYAREALGVKTFDLYNMVLGAYGGRIDGVFSIGGGEDETGIQPQVKANRFRSVVRFIGPFFLNSGKTDVHSINIPNYIGSVKVMVVAGYKGAYGNAYKEVPVRKPLMLLTTLPRVIGPGEKVTIPVNVFVMEDQIKNVNVKIESNQLINLASNEQIIKFKTPGDTIIDFEASVVDTLGIGKIKVKATSGREQSMEEIEIDVRSPNPSMTEYYYGVLDPGQKWEKDFKLPGIIGTNTGELEVSTLPPVDFGRRLKYLLEYPYGCLEQITSAVFPQLFLADIMDVNDNFKIIIDRNIKAGIQSIQKFQLYNGGLGLWPNSTLENIWCTNYAGHFMLEAQKKGYVISNDWLKNWLNFQKSEAKKWNATKYETKWQQNALELSQAYRLYTLAVAGQPELGAMNRLREKNQLSISAKWMLASAYAIAGQKESATDMIKSLTTEIDDYHDTQYTYGSELRDKGFILETMNLLDMRDEAVPVLQFISGKLSSQSWYSTQTLSVCLMAVAKFAGSGKTSKDLNFEFSLNDSRIQKAASKNPYSQIPINFNKLSNGQIRVNNTGTGIIFVRVSLHGIPKAGMEKKLAQNLSMNVKYKDLNGNIINPSILQQGSDFLAEVTIHNPGMIDTYNNLALSQIFPSGWEIQNTRLFESVIGNYSTPEYIDIRDDRVYIFFSLGKNQSKTFGVKLNAAYRGRFYLPGIRCEEMYRNDIQAVEEGTWVEVVKSGK